MITQRELGLDTDSWEAALKNTLRQAPDVILMGEIRDRETMEHAIAFAETGHLCLATLHANSANQALDRSSTSSRKSARAAADGPVVEPEGDDLAAPDPQPVGKGVAAVEIMLNSPLIADLIFKGDVSEIKEIMKKSRNLGMQTFDQALFDLFEDNVITYEDALRNADSERPAAADQAPASAAEPAIWPQAPSISPSSDRQPVRPVLGPPAPEIECHEHHPSPHLRIHPPARTVAFLGWVSGYPMAAHLARAGHHRVTVYNRTTAKSIGRCDQFTMETAKTAETRARRPWRHTAFLLRRQRRRPAPGHAGADGAFAGMTPGAVFVDHTTASADVARELHAAAKLLACTSSTRQSPADRRARRTAPDRDVRR